MMWLSKLYSGAYELVPEAYRQKFIELTRKQIDKRLLNLQEKNKPYLTNGVLIRPQLLKS